MRVLRAILLALVPLLLVSAATPLHAEERIVAVGDIHGDYDAFVRILRAAGLVDAKTRWSGGRTTLVVTGDFVDRGPDVRRVMDLLMDLEKSAPRKRGRVVVLLGNHELMNLSANYPFVNKEAFGSFATRRSEKVRTDSYASYLKAFAAAAERYGEQAPKPLSEEKWMEAHPPGYFEYQKAFARDGKYGKWLRSKQAVAKIGDTVFVHGGISSDFADQGLDRINERLRIEIEGIDRIREYLVAQKLILPFYDFEEVKAVVDREVPRLADASDELRRVVTAYDGIYQWMIYNAVGPLWFRGYAEWSDEEGTRAIEPLLEQIGARRIVVGHTMPEGTSSILARFGQRVFLIDTGMLRNSVEGGRPSALEIVGGKVVAIYENQRVEFVPRSGALPREHHAPRTEAGSHAPRLHGAQRSSAIVLFAAAEPVEPRKLVWRGPNATTLPFTTPAEVADFLREAKSVKVDKKKLPGAAQPQRLVIEKGAVRARAVFRSLHREELNGRWETGEVVELLRDSWKSEIAAYELALLLGIDRIPPTVPWKLKKSEGSLQLWIEAARPGWHPSEMAKPSDPDLWQRHRDSVRIFDALIANVDRHELNMLVDSTGRVWWIDHTRSFLRERELADPDSIRRCERHIWEALRNSDPEAIAKALSPWMSQQEIDALLERRLKLIALIQKRIDDHGEEAVLFTIDENFVIEKETPSLGSAA